MTKSTYAAYRGPYYDSNDAKAGCSNLHFPGQVVSIQTCVQTEGCGKVQGTVLVWSVYDATAGVVERLRAETGGWADVRRVPFEPMGADVRALE